MEAGYDWVGGRAGVCVVVRTCARTCVCMCARLCASVCLHVRAFHSLHQPTAVRPLAQPLSQPFERRFTSWSRLRRRSLTASASSQERGGLHCRTAWKFSGCSRATMVLHRLFHWDAKLRESRVRVCHITKLPSTICAKLVACFSHATSVNRRTTCQLPSACSYTWMNFFLCPACVQCTGFQSSPP